MMRQAEDPNTEVKRVDTVYDLPDLSVLCAWRGHAWPETMALKPIDTWGPVKAAEVKLTCECGRWRRDVFDTDDGSILSRNYGGGYLLIAGGSLTRNEARAEWARRQFETKAIKRKSVKHV